jgi:hypothetical protein
MEEGCGWLVGIVLALALVIAVLYFLAIAVLYILAFLGLAIIFPLDFFASSFSWIGLNDPAIGWLLVGLFVGGVIGLAKGLKRAGRTSDGWKVYGGAGIVAFILFLAASLAYPTASGSETQTERAAPSPKDSETVTQPKLAGTWAGTFNQKSATLVINSVNDNNQFYGNLTVGDTRLAIAGNTGPGLKEVTIRETAVLRGTGWSLGTNTGVFANDGRSMSGTGQDSRTSYSWEFFKQ